MILEKFRRNRPDSFLMKSEQCVERHLYENESIESNKQTQQLLYNTENFSKQMEVATNHASTIINISKLRGNF